MNFNEEVERCQNTSKCNPQSLIELIVVRLGWGAPGMDEGVGVGVGVANQCSSVLQTQTWAQIVRECGSVLEQRIAGKIGREEEDGYVLTLAVSEGLAGTMDIVRRGISHRKEGRRRLV